MRVGKKVKIDLSRYEVSWFNIKGPQYDEECHGSCGTHALACITGKKPKTINKHLPKTSDSWTTRRMLKYLKENGYTVIPLTIELALDHSVAPKHVILVGQYVTRDEGTWSVQWNGLQYHSGDTEFLRPHEYLKNPIDNAYIIWHPKWVWNKKNLGNSSRLLSMGLQIQSLRRKFLKSM